MQKHILVAAGLATDSRLIEAAVRAALAMNAHVTVLHVVDSLVRFAPVPEFDVAAATMEFERLGRQLVLEVADSIREACCDVETSVVLLPLCSCTVGEMIAAVAQRVRADAIVMGASRRRSWQFWSDNVVRDVTSQATATVIVAEPARTHRVQPVAESSSSLAATPQMRLAHPTA